MTVGSLGNIVFSVSTDKIETITNIRQSGSASFAEHKRHCGNTLLEFTGKNADTFSFDITLAAELGVDVEKEIEKIVSAEQSGEALRLVIGKKTYGRYKWVIKNHTETMKYFDKHNQLIMAEVSVNLYEYLK